MPDTNHTIILAVDDKPFILNMITSQLQDEKYKTACVTTAKDALKYLESHTPDLFILDIEMPEMNGLDLAQKIRDGGNMVPIIFLTASTKKDYIERAKGISGTDYIIKPVNKPQLIEAIKRNIKRGRDSQSKVLSVMFQDE